jgi:hypothetical protein
MAGALSATAEPLSGPYVDLNTRPGQAHGSVSLTSRILSVPGGKRAAAFGDSKMAETLSVGGWVWD